MIAKIDVNVAAPAAYVNGYHIHLRSINLTYHARRTTASRS